MGVFGCCLCGCECGWVCVRVCISIFCVPVHVYGPCVYVHACVFVCLYWFDASTGVLVVMVLDWFEL